MFTLYCPHRGVWLDDRYEWVTNPRDLCRFETEWQAHRWVRENWRGGADLVVVKVEGP